MEFSKAIAATLSLSFLTPVSAKHDKRTAPLAPQEAMGFAACEIQLRV